MEYLTDDDHVDPSGFHVGQELLERSRPSRLATIDRTEASSGSEAPGVAATGRFAACPEWARARVTPTTPLASRRCLRNLQRDQTAVGIAAEIPVIHRRCGERVKSTRC
jgi:hypothetical protein